MPEHKTTEAQQAAARGYRGAASLVGLAWRELERDHPAAGDNAPFRAAITRMQRAERALLDAARDAERTNG
jgi:hypothetical protein